MANPKLGNQPQALPSNMDPSTSSNDVSQVTLTADHDRTVLEQMKESAEIYNILKKQFKELNTKDRRDFAVRLLPCYQAVLEDPDCLWTLSQQNVLNHLKMIMDYLHREDVMALVDSIEQLGTFLIHGCTFLIQKGRNRNAKIVNEIKLQTIGVIMNLARLVSDFICCFVLLLCVCGCFVLFLFFV